MRYVIIGAGIAGVSVAKALKKGNPSASVVIVTRERDAYYSRPLLSHGITREDIAERIVIETFKALRIEGLEIFEGTSVLSIDRRKWNRKWKDEFFAKSILFLFIVSTNSSFHFLFHFFNCFSLLIASIIFWYSSK